MEPGVEFRGVAGWNFPPDAKCEIEPLPFNKRARFSFVFTAENPFVGRIEFITEDPHWIDFRPAARESDGLDLSDLSDLNSASNLAGSD